MSSRNRRIAAAGIHQNQLPDKGKELYMAWRAPLWFLAHAGNGRGGLAPWRLGRSAAKGFAGDFGDAADRTRMEVVSSGIIRIF